MKCLNCGEWFAEQGLNQKYCSAACGEKYRRKHPVKTRYPSITFTCAKCGKEVVTDGIRDKRTHFVLERVREDTGGTRLMNIVR